MLEEGELHPVGNQQDWQSRKEKTKVQNSFSPHRQKSHGIIAKNSAFHILSDLEGDSFASAEEIAKANFFVMNQLNGDSDELAHELQFIDNTMQQQFTVAAKYPHAKTMVIIEWSLNTQVIAMNLLSWHARDLNRPPMHSEISCKIADLHLNFLAMTETKVRPCNLPVIRDSFFQEIGVITLISPIAPLHYSQIWLCWSNSIAVYILEDSAQHVHRKASLGPDIYIYFFYYCLLW